MKDQHARHGSRSSRWVTAAVAAIAVLCIAGSGWGGSGALAQAPSSTQPGQPNATCAAGGQCFADVSAGNPFYAFVNRIYQQDLVSGYPCGGTGEPCDPQNRPYYRPNNNVTRQQMAKFIDNARHLPGIDIEVNAGTPPIISHNNTGSAITAYSTSGQALIAQSSTQSAIYAQSGNATVISAYSTGGSDSVGVYGSANVGVEGVSGAGNAAKGVVGSSDSGYGMYTSSNSGTGLYAHSNSNSGVYGDSNTGTGVWGFSTSNIGVYGTGGLIGVQGAGSAPGSTGLRGDSDSGDGIYGSSNSGKAIHGFSPGAGNWAGFFEGNVNVSGTCCAMGLAYTRIDDPLDPANKYLNQSLVQSADMSSVINGNVALDGNGEATVTLPAWFEAANGDFRYSLTAVGAPGPNLYIAQELSDNRFKIAGGNAGGKVSWQVTGIRQDPYAKQHPVAVEENKPADEQGKYLHPVEYGQPESAGVNYAEDQKALAGKR